MELERPKEEDGPGLWGVVKGRRSFRDFTGKEMSKSELSQLLWASAGRTQGWRRAPPSAGGLYPVETYVVVNSVEGVGRGVYHYDVEAHGLEEIEKGDFSEAVARAALGQEQASTASAVFVWTIVFERCAAKYGERAQRYVYMDAGHVAQNLLLAAEALGLGACPMAAFHDEQLNGLVGADGKGEFAAYLAAVGRK